MTNSMDTVSRKIRGGCLHVPLVGALLLIAALPARAHQSPAFRAVHYDVKATLRATEQTIAAQATVTVEAAQVSRIVTFELHPDLNISSVTGADGKPLGFDRDPANALRVRVTLDKAYAPGQQATITLNYAGPVSGENDSPTQGLRLASVDSHAAYLLLASRWFPLTNFPSDRYTAAFHIIAPKDFAVVGTGDSGTPSMVGADQVEYDFQCSQPAAWGTFVAGPLELTPVQAEGMSISVYAPPKAASATEYGDTLAKILTSFTARFGQLPSPQMTIAQLPDGSVDDYAAPGLILIGARHWTATVDDGRLARLAASQWWGNAVMPATAEDAWLSGGLAAYSEALYVREDSGESAQDKILRDFAVGALMFENLTPISQAEQLTFDSPQYISVVVDKGAMVFHMLSTTLGTETFEHLLTEFYSEYKGKNATLADFEKLAKEAVPPASAGRPAVNLNSFFSQWLNSTGVPEFKLEYIVYRTQKGFKVVGTIKQQLEAFNMPVEVRVETEGNPETKTVEAIGTKTEFVVDTFGRPKPDGISIDPDNHILKSSPHLRVLAAVARGELEAERGKYYEAIQDYQDALQLQSNNSLALFRMGEAMFYQKNYEASANSFRDALDGEMDPGYRWVAVWSHIYLGKIFDLTGQRERAVNEYARAQESKDNTDGAQEEAAKYLNKPYTGATTAPPAKPATADSNSKSQS